MPERRSVFALLISCAIRYLRRLRMDKLTEIMDWKRREIAARLRDVPEPELAALAAGAKSRPSFRGALHLS